MPVDAQPAEAELDGDEDSRDSWDGDSGPSNFREEEDTPERLISSIGWVIGDTITVHLCNSRSDFCEYGSIYRLVTTEDGVLPAIGRGSVFLEWLLPDGSIQTTTLCNVWHVPTVRMSYISKSALQHVGVEFFPGPRGVSISLDGFQVGQALWQQGLPILSVAFPTSKIRRAAKKVIRGCGEPASLDTWHQRIAHLEHVNVHCLTDVATGVEIDYTAITNQCDTCDAWEKKRTTLRVPPMTATRKLQLVHADICGPIDPPSLCGSRYYVVFVDDFTRATWLYFINQSSQCAETLRTFQAQTKNRREGVHLETLRYSGGGEFGKLDVRNHLELQGIGSELKPPGESAIPMLMETALHMLQSNKLPGSLWVEVISTVTYLRNRSPIGVADDTMTPYESCFGSKPDLSHVRAFGSPVYADSLEIAPGKELTDRSVVLSCWIPRKFVCGN